MKPQRLPISGSLVLVLLALVTSLLAPVAAFSHGSADSGPVASLSSSDDCHGKSADHQDDCCETTACPCACHAPLVTGVMILPLPVTVPLRFATMGEPLFPQVYLPIFVPPQNRS